MSWGGGGRTAFVRLKMVKHMAEEGLMDVVFSTKDITRAKRYNAWRDAICDSYVHFDVDATRPDDYRGFIREEHFGDVVLRIF